MQEEQDKHKGALKGLSLLYRLDLSSLFRMDPAPPPPGPDNSLPHLLQVELPARYFSPDVGASPIAQQEEEDKIQGAWDSEQRSWEDQPLSFNIHQGFMKEGKEEGSDALNHYHFLDWVAVPASAIGICGCGGH